MKKLLLFTTIFMSTVYAHECQYTLNVDLDAQNGKLRANAVIKSDHPSMKLLNTKSNIVSIKNAKLTINENTPYLIKEDVKGAVEINFTHNFQPINGDVVLLNNWYPKIDVMCKYETIIKNSEVTAVVEATKIIKEKDATRFIFDRPLDTLTLVASKNYIVNSKKAKDGMELSTYFYPSDAPLSEKYLQKTEEYFKLYKEMFGFAPINNFSVVEAPFPAGNAMPTFTLIGQQIINKDFVINNSLGHEITHQWFGNYVYYPSQGNWVEGMTTFYSDYLYAKKENRDVQYRKDMLIKYNSYVNKNNEIALIEFKHKNSESINAIGYAKATFFFYMLEKKIGEKAFSKGIKKLLKEYPYKVASYKTLREIFESVSGVELLEFFKTWVYKKGALDFNVANINLKFIEDRYILEFDLMSNIQTGYLPISICSDEECLSTRVDMSKQKQRLELDIEPTKIVLDERYELFRKLDVTEVPPVISKVLQRDALVVVDRADKDRFSDMIKAFKDVKYADEITYDEMKSRNLFVLGAKNSLLDKIALAFEMEGDTKIELFKNPLNEANVVAVFETKKLSRTFFYKLKHLGKYSTVVIKDGVTLKKTTKESSRGITCSINSGSFALKPKRQKLSDTYKEIVKSRVVFIGEMHTEFASHLNQLKIIKAMYKNNPKLSIGMEMFQKPFQKYLDAYIDGKISEKEMLIKTEYFKRWKYDYELYRPIMLFAKKKHIPIIALNIDREITGVVVSQGLDALSETQREEVPNSINFSNPEYKKYLKSIFSMHQSKKFKNFDEFCHAQLIWDETMAKNIVEYLNENSNHSMAVLAGNGHVMFGHGIPSRIARRGINDYTITLNSIAPENGIADYILYSSTIETNKAKKLGVYLVSDDKLEVIKLVENSVASKAKIKAGDVLVAFNGEKVKDKYDLKVELVFIEGEGKLTVIRDSKELELVVNF